MTTLAQDGFEWMPFGASQADRVRLWGANRWFLKDNGGFAAADVIAPGRFGYGQAFSLYGSIGGFFGHFSGYTVPLGSVLSTGFLGMAVYVDSNLPSQARPCLGFYDGVNDNMQLAYSFDANGVIKVWLGNPTNTSPIATSVSGVYQEDEWFHVEAKPVIASSGGSLEIRVNTVPVVQLVGANTQFTSVAGFDCAFIGAYTTNNNVAPVSAHPVVFDDFFFNDTNGTTNNTWQGNTRVKTQFMIANGATNNFTIGGTSPAATHWQSVLNQLLDDTKYEYSGNVGDIDLFTPDPNLNAPLVRAVQVRMGLRQDDATQRVARALLRIGSTNYLGSVDQYTNQTYTFYKELFQLSPATGVSFTGSEVNGLQAGVKVQV